MDKCVGTVAVRSTRRTPRVVLHRWAAARLDRVDGAVCTQQRRTPREVVAADATASASSAPDQFRKTVFDAMDPSPEFEPDLARHARQEMPNLHGCHSGRHSATFAVQLINGGSLLVRWACTRDRRRLADRSVEMARPGPPRRLAVDQIDDHRRLPVTNPRAREAGAHPRFGKTRTGRCPSNGTRRPRSTHRLRHSRRHRRPVAEVARDVAPESSESIRGTWIDPTTDADREVAIVDASVSGPNLVRTTTSYECRPSSPAIVEFSAVDEAGVMLAA